MKAFCRDKVMEAKTAADFDAAWTTLLSKSTTKFKAYLLKEWYPCRQRWARPWRDAQFTQGYVATSPVESMNSRLAKCLTQNSSLSASANDDIPIYVICSFVCCP